MTVISAGVVNRQGRVLLARQFTDISRTRIESLLSAFPRLLEASVNKQVTYIEADTVRYVYQPLEDMYLVLVTSCTSNIVEDLATLHLMGQLVPEYVGSTLSEGAVEAQALMIVMAFDEVVVGGQREDTTVDQIHTYLRMDSIEERNAQLTKQMQLENARRITAERARELREKRRALMLTNHSGVGSAAGMAGGGGDAYAGIGPSDFAYGGSSNTNSSLGGNVMVPAMTTTAGGGDGGGSAAYNSAAYGDYHASPYAPASGVGAGGVSAQTLYDASGNATGSSIGGGGARAAQPRNAMSLGKLRKADVMSKVQEEIGGRAALTPAPPPLPPSSSAPAGHVGTPSRDAAMTSGIADAGSSSSSAAPTAATVARGGVHIIVEEHMSATLSRGGEAVPTDIRGRLSVLVGDAADSHVVLCLALLSTDFAFRAHAKVNKARFASENVLAMSDGKPLPVQQPVSILRWSLHSPGSIQPPITFACWPEVGSITVEYELVNVNVPPLERVRVVLPLYGCVPASYEASVGTCTFAEHTDNNNNNGGGGCLIWTIPRVDGEHNSSGHVEIVLPDGGQTAPDGVFFPVDIAFASVVSVGLVHVAQVLRADTGASVPFTQETRLVTERLQIA